MFPCGSVSLYGGWNGYILVSFDETSPGLAFNSQNNSYSKWTFKHDGNLQCHNIDSISENIDHLVSAHPQLDKCLVRQTMDLSDENTANASYAWFNVYCFPGYGEWFKQNEQVWVENNSSFGVWCDHVLYLLRMFSNSYSFRITSDTRVMKMIVRTICLTRILRILRQRLNGKIVRRRKREYIPALRRS